MASIEGDKEAPNRARMAILWSFARPHLRTLILGLVLALIGSAMGLATPMVTKWVLDSLAGSESLSGPVLTLLALMIVGAAVLLWQWTLLGALGERVVFDVRESMVRRLFRATIPAVTGRPSGEFVTRVTSDTLLLREAASSSVIGLVNGAVMLAGSMVLMGVLDLVLLGTTVAAIAVVGVVFALLMPAIAKAQERAQDHVGKLGGALESAVRAIRTVKASRAEDRQADRILTEARASADYGIRAVRREATSWTIAWSGVQLAIILILGIGAWRVSQGQLEVSSLIAFLLYAFGLIDPITELTQNTTALQSGIAAAGRIRDVEALEMEADERRPVPTSGPVSGENVLELREVVAAYGPDMEPAVKGVDLAVPKRGHVAIVGPSGAGKTTMFSLILRFLRPQNGELYLGGRPYGEYTHDELRAHLAYVEQEAPIVPGTIRENLLFTHPDASEEELREVLGEVRLLEKIDSLDDGLDTPLSSTAVSGGERQRIALARAILRSPDVLLLDEATAQVDALTEAAIHDCIRRRASTGAVVTIAHRLSTVLDADTIVVMEAGRVRAIGDHERLLATDDLYRKLVEALRIANESETVSIS
ncbi:ATP-binding cassette subfamily B protein [Herbihabitans rhizosphaerae]|uniref:ATP-binding cassette subfamily B protein n=1 Tax=Herbihabitans rhizosphaerae TaxID=1872711 RepID=A0A4Q7KEZ5_9PSEU|nr:ABC transporter ATP-binding protein [Herbihabitans rhizosphaerae]RZS32463.1 ATP-binding cassette subfamily B protein [Herbihabitans rhizosphaerae]